MLEAVAAVSSGRPRLVLVLWLLVLLSLGAASSSLESKVSTRPIYTAGSDAARAHEIAVREFGGEDAMVVMLRGPRPALERQGPALVERLKAMPRTLTISPWSSGGSIEGLRPSPRVAAVLVTIGQPEGEETDTVAAVQRQVDGTVRAPVRVSVAGGPAVVSSLRDAVQRAGSLGELLAIPALMLVLLLVCRSLLAAAMPLVVGGLVVGATKGFLALIAGLIAIDSIAIGIASMFGLALGVDYSLLVVSRFREELEGSGGDLPAAVRATVLATGKSIVPAGCGLILAMLVALAAIPGSFVASFTIAVSAASVLSVLSAMFAMPALLMLLGSRLDRWSLPRRRRTGSLAIGWSTRFSRRPGVVLGIVFLLMLCGAWAFTLHTNTGAVTQLPEGDPGRVQQEDIERELGPGWTAPFEIIVQGKGGPITTKHRLDALAAFQRRVEKDPGVAAMAGFAGLAQTTKQLGAAEQSLAQQEAGVEKVNRGLGGVQKGTLATTGGFAKAASGAGELGSAIGATRDGSGKIAAGLDDSAEGSAEISGGLDKASDGSGKLASATSKVSDGAAQLAEKAKGARKQAAEAVGATRTLKSALRAGEETLQTAPLESTEEELAAAWEALQRMTAGRGDAQYTAAIEAVRAATVELTGAEPEEEEANPSSGVVVQVQDALNQFNLGLYLTGQQDESGVKARDGIGKLAKASTKLDRGLRKLLGSTREFSGGLTRLSSGGEKLSPGLRRLATGAERLLSGLTQIESSTGSLAGGLDEGARRSRRLNWALERLHSGTEQKNGSQSQQVNAQSPGLFESGYFYLAGLEGSKPERRNQAGFLVNLANGGSTARMLVIPEDELASPAAEETGERLAEDAEALSRETGAEVIVGGLTPNIVGVNEVLREQAPLARIVLALVTIIVLIPVTRSLALPILAALLNILTVSATFGLLSLLFNGSLLGGPGFVDTSVIPISVILTFGLAIDYEVFIFARIREEYLRTGSTERAIANGLGQTAHVISAAAVIMIAVFLAFAISPLASMRNIGVGQAIGVFIDAFLIRLVILPATMRALGDRCWWVPRWLRWLIPGSGPPRMPAEAEA